MSIPNEKIIDFDEFYRYEKIIDFDEFYKSVDIYQKELITYNRQIKSVEEDTSLTNLQRSDNLSAVYRKKPVAYEGIVKFTGVLKQITLIQAKYKDHDNPTPDEILVEFECKSDNNKIIIVKYQSPRYLMYKDVNHGVIGNYEKWNIGEKITLHGYISANLDSKDTATLQCSRPNRYYVDVAPTESWVIYMRIFGGLMMVIGFLLFFNDDNTGISILIGAMFFAIGSMCVFMSF